MRAFAFPHLVAFVALCLMAGGAARAQSGAAADMASYTEAVELVRHAAGEALIGGAPLREAVEEDFNVRYVGLLALGPHRRDLDTKSLGEFDEIFAGYLAARYAAFLAVPADAVLEIVGVAPAGPRDAIVSTAIKSRGGSARAEWRVRFLSSRPQVIDVSVEGASLIDRQRTEIEAWLKEAGANGLIERMRGAAGDGP